MKKEISFWLLSSNVGVTGINLRINVNFDGIHFGIANFVFGRVDENFIENLVQACGVLYGR